MEQTVATERHEGQPGVLWHRAGAWPVYGLAAIVALLALAPKLDAFDYFNGKFLWAEDGNVFLNQAQSLGLAAILKPYAGYLHLYPRLVTALSQLVDLIHRPSILLLGWFAAYLVMVHAITASVVRKRGGVLLLAPLLVLVALQPNQGEVLFNITNAQWMLGAALILHVLADDDVNDRSLLRCGALLVLALTGPFSIILVPVMIIRLWLRRDWPSFKCTYLVVCLGACVQLAVLLANPRNAAGPATTDAWLWLTSFLRLAGFGAGAPVSQVAAIAIWAIILGAIAMQARRWRQAGWALQKPLLLLLVALTIICAGLVAYKHDPSIMADPDTGNRYTWIPNILVLTSIVLLAGARRLLAGLAFLLFAVICFNSFQKPEPANLQFSAFARFHEVAEVVIPINPQWPQYPGWHIAGRKPVAGPSPAPIAIPLTPDGLRLSGLEARFVDGTMEIQSVSRNPRVEMRDRISCPGSTAAGLNISLSRQKPGWLQLFWSATADFNDDESIWRWYPAGDIKAQFAFSLADGGTYLRFDPMRVRGQATISRIELFCL